MKILFNINYLCLLIIFLLQGCGGGNEGVKNTQDTNRSGLINVYVDEVTGLVWQKVGISKYPWHQAVGIYDATYNPDLISVCGQLDLEGYKDWRLPTRKELFSITRHDVNKNLIDTYSFQYSLSGNVWSSTKYAANPDLAWPINFSDGSTWAGWGNKGAYYSVVCVRGESLSLPNFIDNTDGTVTDQVSGLMWQKEDDDVPRIWVNAISYCEMLHLGGYDDWRLPKIKELITIIDEETFNPAVDVVFPNTNMDYYWTSTLREGSPSEAWPIQFSDGSIPNYTHYKTNKHYVRCVRNI